MLTSQNKKGFACVGMLLAGWLWAGPVRAADDHGQHDHAAMVMAQPGDSGLVADAQMENPVIAGNRAGVMVKLRHSDDDGAMPLFWDELEEQHESRIHLMIIDRALGDYHHEHPMRTETEGEYAFMFDPRTSCSYKVWAQVFFRGGKEKMVNFTLPGRDDCSTAKPDTTTNNTVTVDGYKFDLAMSTASLKNGADTMLTLTVSDKDGQPFEGLEPVMGAYAHLVGFYDDYESIAHIHPLGEEPTSDKDRGGPALQFHFRPDHAGFMKLYAQVRIGNRMVFAPFGVMIEP